MGIAHPLRGTRGRAAGLCMRTAPSGARPCVIPVNVITLVLVRAALLITNILESCVHNHLKTIPLKGHELLGGCMLNHAKGYAHKYGQSTSIVLLAMANCHVFATHVFYAGSGPRAHYSL